MLIISEYQTEWPKKKAIANDNGRVDNESETASKSTTCSNQNEENDEFNRTMHGNKKEEADNQKN